MKRRMRLSRGGQISIPAPIRHRWGTTALTIDDQGDRLVIEPADEDPVAVADGALAEYFKGVDPSDLRATSRIEDQEASERRDAGR